MKKYLLLLFIVLFYSCNQVGKSSTIINGTEKNLPDELKGLKVYDVYTGTDNIQIATFDNRIVRTITYQQGDSRKIVALISNHKNDTIIASTIVMENDTLILLKK